MRETFFCFHYNKSTDESHRMLMEAYGDNSLHQTNYRVFKNNEFDLKGLHQQRNIEDGELKVSLKENSRRVIKGLSETLFVDDLTVNKHSKAIKLI